jgi:hypothetical protein
MLYVWENLALLLQEFWWDFKNLHLCIDKTLYQGNTILNELYPAHLSKPNWNIVFVVQRNFLCGPGGVVGIVTDYGLDGLGIESQWGARFSAPVQTGPGAHPASCIMGMRSDADPSPPSNAVVMKE